MNYSERMKAIITVIRERKDWIGNHNSMDFGNQTIGYYDTERKDAFFELKYNEIEVTHMNDSKAQIELPWKAMDFCLGAWLSEIEAIVKQRTIIIDGKKYLLQELKDA